MNIRHASLADLESITAIESACFPEAEAAKKKDFEARLQVYPECFWVLCNQNVMIGFVNGFVTDQKNLTDEMYEKAKMHDPKGDWQMIFGVNTLPEYRRKGFAEKILNQVILDARQQGRKGLVLTCKDALRHYYAKFGFVDEGISESMHGNVIWYQMRLTF